MSATLAAASPMYVLLAQRLAQAIRNGSYRAGQSLPSERLLSESLQVSRETARRAVARLVEQRLVERRRGSGSYVMPLPQAMGTSLTSTADVLHGYGFTPSSKWLGRSIGVPTVDERQALGLSAGERVARLERLHLADDVVVAHELSVLPERLLPDPERVDASLHEHLAIRGVAPVRAQERIRAHNVDKAQARMLQVAVGSAVLFITRTATLECGAALEFTRYLCLSEYLGLVVESRRDLEGP